jgi:hypothetical protein
MRGGKRMESLKLPAPVAGAAGYAAIAVALFGNTVNAIR